MNTTELYPRLIQARLKEALADTPVVLLTGPRQAGKTTLVRQLTVEPGVRYLTLDDELTLLSARQDPTGIVVTCEFPAPGPSFKSTAYSLADCAGAAGKSAA